MRRKNGYQPKDKSVTSPPNCGSKIYFAKQPVFYVCDMKRCKNCTAAIGGPCHHTSDIRHAKYPAPHEFERFGTFLFEKERKDNGLV